MRVEVVNFANWLYDHWVLQIFAETVVVDVELDDGVEAVFVDDANDVFALEDHAGG